MMPGARDSREPSSVMTGLASLRPRPCSKLATGRWSHSSTSSTLAPESRSAIGCWHHSRGSVKLSSYFTSSREELRIVEVLDDPPGTKDCCARAEWTARDG